MVLKSHNLTINEHNHRIAEPCKPQRHVLSDDDCRTVHDRIRGSLQHRSHRTTQQFTFKAMGTQCSVTLVAPSSYAAELMAQVLGWLAEFEAKYSRFIPTSLISLLNVTAGHHPVLVDEETEQLFALCDQMHFITGGVFDPTALPFLRLWDWKEGRIPSSAEVEAARQLVGWRKLQRRPGQVFLPVPGMGLDLGGMGKEYAVDQVSQMLATAGVTGALVDFGGDVRVVGLPGDGRPGWHVGLENPRQPGSCWCGLGIQDGAVASSGEYLRFFESDGRRYGHILDPRTGEPVFNGCRAASVVAPTCTLAGMLSTALLVLGPQEGMRLLDSQFRTAGALLTDNGTFTSQHFYDYVVSGKNS